MIITTLVAGRIGSSGFKEFQSYLRLRPPLVMIRAMPLRAGQAATQRNGSVVALIVGSTERARILEALRGRHNVQCVNQVAQLQNLVSNVTLPVVGYIVESHDVDGQSSAGFIEFVRRTQPHIPIVGYCKAGIAYSSDVRALAQAGVHELLFHGIDDTGSALRAVLALARQRSAGDIVAAAFLRHVPELLGPFVRYVVSHPAEAQRVATVARALGFHRKTLVNHCAHAKLPPPQELLAWCRLGVVGYLLGTSQCTIESIALQLDFPSDTALRNLMKRHTKMRATEVRGAGGLKAIIVAFERAVIAQRAQRTTG